MWGAIQVYVLDQQQFAAVDRNGDELAIFSCEEFGLCVRALVPFSTGDVLDRFTGRITRELTQHSLQVDGERHICDTRFIGYLSHGCDPNCRLDMERFELVALRDIAAGDLLTVDYAHTEEHLFAQFACNCGSPTCRGWISGSKDVPTPAGLQHLAQLKRRTASQ